MGKEADLRETIVGGMMRHEFSSTGDYGYYKKSMQNSFTPSILRRRASTAAFSMIDCLIAVSIVGLFFSALYAVCSQCLGVLTTGRDLANVQQYSQYRIEQLRNCSWAQLTDSNYLRNNVFNATQPGSPMAGKLTETVTINSFPTPVTPAIQISRAPAGPANPVSVNAAVTNADLAQVKLTLSWTPRNGRPARTIATAAILSRF